MKINRFATILMSAGIALLAQLGVGHADGHETEGDQKGEAQKESQDEEKKTWGGMGSLYFIGGAGFFDNDALNGRLKRAGYSELKSPYLTLGVGFTHQVKRFIFGGEFNWLQNVQSEAERDDLQSDIEAWYGLFRFGVVVFEYKGLSIYPLFGIGGGETNIRISEESGASFNEVLDDPRREVRLNQDALLLDASLGIDYRFLMAEKKNHKSYFLLGVRGGYLFAPYATDWEMGGGEVSNGPKSVITGPTAMLTLGFSRKYESHKKNK